MTILRVPRELMIFFNDNREIQRYFIDSTNIMDDVLLIGNLLGTTNQIIVTDNGDKTVTLSLPQDIDTDADVVFDSITVETVNYELGLAAAAELEGRTSWNNDDKTLNIDTGLGPVLQTNQETVVLVYNDTGVEILNGVVVHPVAGATDGRPHIEPAISNTHVGISRDIWVTTMNIPDQTVGIVTQFGYVRGVDTSLFIKGDNLWVSPDNAGGYVNARPEFPDYAIQVGGVAVSDALEGVIFIDVKGRPADTTLNFWNGVFRESFDFLVTSDGATITGTLSPANGHEDMTMIFSDGLTLLDTSPPATIALIPGTDENEQTNFVYIPKSTKVLTVSTSDWPTTEYIKVAQLSLQTAVTTQEDGELRNQNINDAIENSSFQGFLSVITENIRSLPAKWKDGIEGSVVIDVVPTPDSVIIKTTAGRVRQMSLQSFPAQDMTQYVIDAVSTGLGGTFTISGDGDLSANFIDGSTFSVHNSTNNDLIWTVSNTSWVDPDFVITVEADETVGAIADGTIGDDIHIINDFVQANKSVLDLGNEQTDSLGNSLNNLSFSFVVWGVQNKTGSPQHLMLNLPTGGYSKNFPVNAVEDADNKSVYSIPIAYEGVGFLIARFTFILVNNSWTLYDIENLRGKIPNTTAGGGAGGSGVTTFLGLTDTYSAYTGLAGHLLKVNSTPNGLEDLDPTTDWLAQYLRTDGTRDLTGNMAVDPLITIDGRDLSVDGTKLDKIEVVTSDFVTDFSMTTSGTITINASYDTLSYIRIGELVTITGDIRITSVSSPVGTLEMNLPFSIKTGNQYTFAAGIGTYNVNFVSDVSPIVRGLSGASVVKIQSNDDVGAWTNTIPAAGDRYILSFSYFTDD